jgi:ketosteroid isomerase-like protein
MDMSDAATLVQSAYDAFGRGDVPAVLGTLSDRVEWDVSAILPQGGSWRGREGVGEFFAGLGSHWADLRIEVDELVDGGATVAAIGHGAGRLREHGDAAAGYKFVHVFDVDGGQIVRFREWGDPDEELREHLT